MGVITRAVVLIATRVSNLNSDGWNKTSKKTKQNKTGRVSVRFSKFIFIMAFIPINIMTNSNVDQKKIYGVEPKVNLH